MAPGTPGPSGPKAPLEPFPVPQRTLDLRREEVYLRITLCVHEPASTNPSARRGRRVLGLKREERDERRRDRSILVGFRGF
jgi:hypothetical protein